mgnify:CR=1 FL=1
MERKKIVITLLTVLVVMFLMVGKSFAAGSYSASLTPNNSKTSKGSEVKVTLKLSGISVDGGINALTATLKYDSDVLSLKKSDVKGMNDWSVTYNEDNNKLAIDSGEPVTEDTEIATFTFKVNDSTSATTAAIQLVSIAAGNSSISEEVKISDITTNISIGTSINPSTSPSESPSTSPVENTTNRVVNNTPSENKTSNSTTTKNEAMPYTGAENYVLPLMLALVVLGIVSFVNYKKIESK